MFAVVAGVCLTLVAAGVYFKRFRVTRLNPGELNLKRGDIRPPTAEDCSALLSSGQGLLQSQTLEKARRTVPFPSDDEMAIYQAVLQQWAAGDRHPVKIAVDTYPLDFTHGEQIPCECLKDFESSDLWAASDSSHKLTPKMLPLRGMRLVDLDEISQSHRRSSNATARKTPAQIAEADIANGIFWFSEIAFDSAHGHALVSYSFH